MNRTLTITFSILLLLFSCTCTGSGGALKIPECRISTPPAELGLPAFYTKYVDVNGIPLISSRRVPDSALVAAHRTLYAMTGYLKPEILEAMIRSGARVAVMARYEGTTDIPEHAYLAADTSLNWDVRCRGLEGIPENPLTTCAEENVLCYQIDKYHAEDILVHEFAHAIHILGIRHVDPTIDDRLTEAMEKAIAEGKWYNTYTIDNYQDYFGEGVQDWFGCNAEMPRHDGKHCAVNTRAELKEYDRGLYDILAGYFPETDEPISLHRSEDIYSEKDHPLLPPAADEQEKKNEETFLKIYDKVKDLSDLPAGELTLRIAELFLGTPYISGPIDMAPEDLRVFLDRTDCMLFVEMACCMSLTVKGLKIVQCCDGENFTARPTPSVEHREPSYQLLRANLRNMRYRCGGIYGYSSRIHYGSEWILQNRTNGLMEEFTRDIGIRHPQEFSWMTAHRGFYPLMAGDPFEIAKIKGAEERLQAQAPYWYIPQEKIPSVIGQIRDGDLIFFVDRHDGLDIAHMAIACTRDGKMHFIHASSRAGKVIIEPKTLAEYAVNGIRVARLKF